MTDSFIGSGYIPLRIKEVESNNQRKPSRKNDKVVLEFTQIMNQLVLSGLSIQDSLEILSIMNEKSGSSKLSLFLLEMIKKGKSFADSVNECTSYFSSIYRGIIKVGDRIGSVEKIFPKLKSYLENQKKIKDKIYTALLYPLLVLITAVAAFLAMLFFVFPKLETMFSEFGGTAAATLEKNINRMENGILLGLFLCILIFFIVFVMHMISKKNKSLKIFMDMVELKIPLAGKIVTCKEILNFSFAMETLTASGITIESALMESISVIKNEAFRQSLSDIHDRIIKGESLSSSFSRYKIFPQYLTKWLLVGERSGNTEQMFTQIKNYYQGEVDSITTKFMSLVEPILIILIGVFLIILIVTVVIPVFSLYGEII